jgi:hypothetical protein
MIDRAHDLPVSKHFSRCPIFNYGAVANPILHFLPLFMRWEQQPAKNAQKDKDARWTKKSDASFFGYKNHLGVDKAHKLIRKWDTNLTR